VKVFVCEYTCCQPRTEGTATASLRAEGWAMLSAILSDLAAVDGVTVETMLAEDHAPIPFAARRITPRDEERVFRDLAASADYTLVIAPEFNDLLYRRCRWVEECGGHLLGPGSEGVRLTGDKLALARHLDACGVPTPKTVPLAEVLTGTAEISFPVVCKPRQGAGSLATYLLQGPDDLHNLPRDARGGTDFIVQPFVAGAPASVAFLLGPRRCLALPPAAQRLSGDGRFRYLGGHAPLSPALAERAQRVARSAVETLPALRGYVGVDVVLGAAPDGSADQIIEINPRLTTSYVGLRVLARTNLAATMLSLVGGENPPELCWHQKTVAWSADGTIAPAAQARSASKGG